MKTKEEEIVDALTALKGFNKVKSKYNDLVKKLPAMGTEIIKFLGTGDLVQVREKDFLETVIFIRVSEDDSDRFFAFNTESEETEFYSGYQIEYILRAQYGAPNNAGLKARG